MKDKEELFENIEELNTSLYLFFDGRDFLYLSVIRGIELLSTELANFKENYNLIGNAEDEDIYESLDKCLNRINENEDKLLIHLTESKLFAFQTDICNILDSLEHKIDCYKRDNNIRCDNRQDKWKQPHRTDKTYKQKETPKLVELITIPEGSTTTKEEIIEIVRRLKDKGDIALIILYMENKGYISIANRKMSRILRAILAETKGINITKQELSRCYNEQNRNNKLEDAKEKFNF